MEKFRNIHAKCQQLNESTGASKQDKKPYVVINEKLMKRDTNDKLQQHIIIMPSLAAVAAPLVVSSTVNTTSLTVTSSLANLATPTNLSSSVNCETSVTAQL